MIIISIDTTSAVHFWNLKYHSVSRAVTVVLSAVTGNEGGGTCH